MALDIFYTQLAQSKRHIHWYIDRYGRIRGQYRWLRHPLKRAWSFEVCPLQGTGFMDMGNQSREESAKRRVWAGMTNTDAEDVIWAAEGGVNHRQQLRNDMMILAGIDAKIRKAEERIV